LTVYTPEPWLPRLYRPEWLAALTFRWRLERARQLLIDQGCRKIILYIWRPEYAAALGAVPFDVSCYHIDDEYSFADVDVPLEDAEVRLIAHVDQVFIHSLGLLERKGWINQHTAYVPNGVDYEAYARIQPEPADLAAVPHPRIGYTGILKSTLDWDLLAWLSARHSDWSFVFVGPVARNQEIAGRIDALAARPNVHLLGAKSAQSLAAYPQHFDVCIMPYRSNCHSVKYGYPLKLHEYLAGGRPVVGTRIRSVDEFADVVALPSGPEEWSAALAGALCPAVNTVEKRTARQAVARRHDWGVLVGKIADTMCRRLGDEFADRLEQATVCDSVRGAADRSASRLVDVL
jgi:glycosyltransferase involved in cell wall biosynthesis